jgi:hypothetical protein
MESEITRKKGFKTLTAGSIIFLTLVSAVLFHCGVPTVRADSTTVVEVVPSTVSANVSATFTVNINVVNVQNLYAVEATLTWNSSVLQGTSVDVRLGQADGVLYGAENDSTLLIVTNNFTQQGSYTVAATSVGPEPSFNGSGIIVEITFSVAGSGNSTLNLESQLYDRPALGSVSQPIDHTTIGGFFSTPVPENSNDTIILIFLTAALLSVLIAALLYILRRRRAPSRTNASNKTLSDVAILLREQPLQARAKFHVQNSGLDPLNLTGSILISSSTEDMNRTVTNGVFHANP